MAPRNLRGSIRKKLVHPHHTAKLLSKETIPIIDKALYDKVYPSSSTSKAQMQYGLTEAELSNLPQPNYTEVPDYFIEDMPNKPEDYISFKPSTEAEIYSKVEYDMDDEDVAWIELLNDMRKDKNISNVDYDIFEFLIDRFEKECRFDREASFEGKLVDEIPDEEAVCYICTGGMSCETNEILFCDMCNIAVHQECYGVPYVPEGQWLCRRCIHSPSRLLCCVLCPKASGAFKQTDRGFWCHILCAIWIPEVQFSNSIFLDPICCIERIQSARWNMTCSICKYKDIGACVRCKYRTCRVAFHASCAQQAGYAMMMKKNASGYKKQRVHGIYCPKHTPREDANIETENTNCMKVLRPQVAQRLCSNVILIPRIPLEKIKDISDLVDFDKKNIFIRKLLAYWTLKRHLRNGVPMIPSKSLTFEQSPVLATTQSNNSKNHVSIELKNSSELQEQTEEESDYEDLWTYREILERYRILCELVIKREKLKNLLALVKYQCLEHQFLPYVIYLRKLTDKLIELDTDNLFSKAVDGSEAVSARPTDFVQIRSKVDKYQYSTIEEYESDFQAMVSSRITCYPKRTKIYKAASKLKENSKEKFIMAYRDFAKMNSQNIKQDEESENDMPEPLSPQNKGDSYENSSFTEFATEIDYYGNDPGPSTSSYQPFLLKKRKIEEEDVITHQLMNNYKNMAESELEEVNSDVKRRRKPKKIKIKIKKGQAFIKEEDSCYEYSDIESFPEKH